MPQLGEWLPIETAPTEGEEVLLAFGYGFDAPSPLVAGYSKAARKWCIPSTRFTIQAKPTHWMPLPSPPTQS